MTDRHARVLILGSGPAGYTAAIYAARAMLKPLMIQGIQPGGQLTITTDVENYPGFADVIQGPWLMEQMKAQAEHVGTEIVSDHITEVKLDRRPFWLKGDSGQIYTADALIIAPAPRPSGWACLPKQNSRASACRPAPPATASSSATGRCWSSAAATPPSRRRCSSPISRARSSSSTAAMQFRAEKILQNRLFAHPKIKVDLGYDARGCDRHGRSQGRHRRAAQECARPAPSRGLTVDGVFIAIGHKPATELFTGQLPLNAGGYIVTDRPLDRDRAFPASMRRAM